MIPEPQSCMNKVKHAFAAPADHPEIRALLAQCDLPTEGIESAVEYCLVARSGPTLVGTVALEPYRQFGLLRSLAVSPDHRRRGLGQSLCAKIISHARLQGLERLYLLTTGAERFFAALGFQTVTRDAVPTAVRSSTQFHHVCPVSAVCMIRDLGDEVIHASTDLLRLRPDVAGARMWAVSLQQTMLTYFEVEPRSRFESHSHESEQITMVLSGELFFEVRGTVRCIKAGEVIAIPSSVLHAVWTGELPVTAVDAWSPVMKQYEPAKPHPQTSPT